MKRLGRIFKNKWFWIIGAIIFFLIVFPIKTIAVWLGLSNDKYDRIAYNLNLAMATAGTDEDLILNSLRDLKGWELERVYKSFGTRGYGFGGAFVIGKQLNLFEWFDKEFSSIWDRKKLDELRQIWSKTSLKITF